MEAHLELRKLGHTDIKVSSICLGTMTWGQQNTQKEAHQQLDYALERKVNFIDTAEMYPIPPNAETCFETEKIIGQWDKVNLSREKIIIASKVIGPSTFLLLNCSFESVPRSQEELIRLINMKNRIVFIFMNL